MKPYSIMTLSFHGKVRSGDLTLDELLGGLAEVGIEGIEPATSLFAERRDLEDALPDLAAKHGLVMPAYDALANLVSPDPDERRAAVDSVHADLARCERWGIPVAMVAGSRVHPELGPAESRRQVAEGMNRCVEAAAAARVTLAIESFGVQLELHASSAHLRQVVDQCDPRVGVTFDMGNYVLGGDRPAEVLGDWLPRLVHVHVKDFARLPADDAGGLPSRDGHRYAGCRLGQGQAQVKEVLGGLAQAGYEGALSLEMGGADGFAEVAADLALVRRWAEGA